MRYGSNRAKHLEIDPTARRRQGQSLKSAAPGAPYGWNHRGEPYIGTGYRISSDGTTFSSISTRDGGEMPFDRTLLSVTRKVAISALETYGSVSKIPGVSDLSPAIAARVHQFFSHTVCADRLAAFEGLDNEAGPALPATASAEAPEASPDGGKQGEKRARALLVTQDPQQEAVAAAGQSVKPVLKSNKSARLALSDAIAAGEAGKAGKASRKRSESKSQGSAVVVD